jgi:CHAT domain-containing protein/predicted negative regulator of RcsB-dependent stress response
MGKGRWIQILVIVLCLVWNMTLGQDKVKEDDQYNKWQEEVLTIYEIKGEEGLRNYAKKEKNDIVKRFILNLAKYGSQKKNEDWLKASKILAEEKTDENLLANVLYETAGYFYSVGLRKKSKNFLERALKIFKKNNDELGVGNVLLKRGDIFLYSGDYAKAKEVYDEAKTLFQKNKHYTGIGNIYLRNGTISNYSSDYPNALICFKKALLNFEKSKDILGQGNVYLFIGDIYIYKGQNGKALEMFEKAISFFKKSKNLPGQSKVYHRKGVIYYMADKHHEALKQLDQSLTLFKELKDILNIGSVNNTKGEIYLKIGDYAKANKMFDKGLNCYQKIENPLGLGNIYLNKSHIYFITGENSKAVESLDKAIHYYKIVGDPLGIGNSYKEKGAIYFRTGNISNALRMYEKALSLFVKAENPHGIGSIHWHLGETYLSIGDYSKAFSAYDKALHYYEQIKSSMGQGNVYRSKGDFYAHRKEYDQALLMYQKAHTYFKKAKAPLGQGNVFRNKGDIYLTLGNNKKAQLMYQNASTFFEKTGNILGQGNVCRGIADIRFNQSNFEVALKLYDKALGLYEKIGNSESEAYILYKKGKLHGKLNKNDIAVTLLEKSIQKLETIRKKTNSLHLKSTFMEVLYELYEECSIFMLKNGYLHSGFQNAERIKSRSFLDNMAEGLIRPNKRVEVGFLHNRDILISKLSILSKKISKAAGKSDEEKLKQLKEEYRNVENQFQKLLIKIRLENPLYASVRYPEPVTVQQLQKKVLNKNDLLLRYFVSKEKTYVFLVSKKRFKVIPINLNAEDVKQLVNRYLDAVEANKPGATAKHGHSLYLKMFKPLASSIKKAKNLIIVPDRELAKVPFETFVIKPAATGKPVYLLEKYRIKYIQSASILAILREHYKRDTTGKRFAGFGDPVYDYGNFKQGIPETGSTIRSPGKKDMDTVADIHRGRYIDEGGLFSRLKASGEEVSAIASIFNGHSRENMVHLRDKATEANAKSPDLKQFDYIHFACHAVLGDRFQSLVLSQLPDSKEDGYLTLNEIMNTDYHAKLVVLSACRTGKGKMERAEGVTGLTRAVMYAGTPAVVASLWDVDDAATKELMVRFYSYMLDKNLDKVESLRKAKLDLLRSKEYASPFYWSAFVMYGE